MTNIDTDKDLMQILEELRCHIDETSTLRADFCQTLDIFFKCNSTKAYFSKDDIKHLSWQSVSKCPRCNKYPAQIGFDSKPRLCLKCEGESLEKNFVF